MIRVKKGQIVEITFEPTDNGLGVGHGLGISSYDENVFINGAMVGVPKTAKFRADHAGQIHLLLRDPMLDGETASPDERHPIVEDDARQTNRLDRLTPTFIVT